MFIMDIIQRNIFLIPIVAVIIAHLIKIIILLIRKGKINKEEMIWSVGMPSGHSAFFSSLTTSIGIKEGMGSPLFAIALIFSLAYIFDLMLVNKVVEKGVKKLEGKLGHSFSEVIVGIGIGIIIAILLLI